VAFQLSNGSYLGNCRVDLNTVASAEIARENDDFSIQASPNPGKDIFILSIRNSSKLKAELIIRDVLGRTMERMIVNGNSQVRIGAGYAPGIYSAELIRGEEKRITRMVKLPK
jgi:hypothetical protein